MIENTDDRMAVVRALRMAHYQMDKRHGDAAKLRDELKETASLRSLAGEITWAMVADYEAAAKEAEAEAYSMARANIAVTARELGMDEEVERDMSDMAINYYWRQGELIASAVEFCHDLMTGDAASFKAGYSRDNALIATQETFSMSGEEMNKVRMDLTTLEKEAANG